MGEHARWIPQQWFASVLYIGLVPRALPVIPMDVVSGMAILRMAPAQPASLVPFHFLGSAVYLARRELLRSYLLPFLPLAVLLVILVNIQVLLDQKLAPSAAPTGAPPSAASLPHLHPLLRWPST